MRVQGTEREALLNLTRSFAGQVVGTSDLIVANSSKLSSEELEYYEQLLRSTPELRILVQEEYLLALSQSLSSAAHESGRALARGAWRTQPPSPKRPLEELLALGESLSFDPSELFAIYRLGILAGRSERLEAEYLAVDIRRKLYGYLRFPRITRRLSRGKEIFITLLSLQAGLREHVEEQYEQRYKTSLRAEIIKHCPPECARSLSSLLSGKLAEALLSYVSGTAELRLKDLKALEGAIWRLPRLERRILERQLRETSASLRTATGNLPREIALAVEHLIHGSFAEYGAHLLQYYMLRANWPEVIELFGRTDSLARVRMQRAYESIYGEPLADRFQRSKAAQSVHEYLQAAIRFDEDGELAWRGKLLLEGVIPGWIGDLLRGPERLRFISAYVSVFGARNLRYDIQARYGGRDREIALDLLDRGAVPWAKLLWFAVAGIGTDEAAVISLLEQSRLDQQAHCSAQFYSTWLEYAPWHERLFPKIFGNLRRRLWLECAGDCWFEIRQSLDQKHSVLERVRERFSHETKALILKLLTQLSRETSIMHEDMERLNSIQLTNEEVSRVHFENLVELVKLDCEVSRMTKHLIGNHLTTALSSAGVFAAVILLTFHDVELHHVMLAVGAFSALLRFSLKTILKGPGYHRDEIFGDLAFAAVDGVTLYMGRLFRQALIRTSARFTSKLGLNRGMIHAIKRFQEVSSEVDSERIHDLTRVDGDRAQAISIPKTTRYPEPLASWLMIT